MNTFIYHSSADACAAPSLVNNAVNNAPVNNAALGVGTQMPTGASALNPLGCVPRVRLPTRMLILLLIF